MKLEYAKNPVWADEDHTMIDLVIKWENTDEELPFTASINDCEEHGRAFFAAAKAGNYGVVAEFVPVETSIDVEEIEQNLSAAALPIEEL